MTREHLPDLRNSVTHTVSIPDEVNGGTIPITLVLGRYADGRPAELFLRLGHPGSLLRGLGNAMGVLISLLLQYGVDPQSIARKLSNSQYPPRSFTDNPQIRICTSITDYIGRWLLQQQQEKP